MFALISLSLSDPDSRRGKRASSDSWRGAPLDGDQELNRYGQPSVVIGFVSFGEFQSSKGDRTVCIRTATQRSPLAGSDRVVANGPRVSTFPRDPVTAGSSNGTGSGESFGLTLTSLKDGCEPETERLTQKSGIAGFSWLKPAGIGRVPSRTTLFPSQIPEVPYSPADK